MEGGREGREEDKTRHVPAHTPPRRASMVNFPERRISGSLFYSTRLKKKRKEKKRKKLGLSVNALGGYAALDPEPHQKKRSRRFGRFWSISCRIEPHRILPLRLGRDPGSGMVWYGMVWYLGIGGNGQTCFKVLCLLMIVGAQRPLSSLIVGNRGWRTGTCMRS